MAEPRAEMPDMAAYGVDRATWEPLSWAWAAERLDGNRNFWIVTVNAGGHPHATPVWGVWDDDEHRFAFSCAHASRKARNLAANPHTVVMAESTVECVSLQGRSVPVTDLDRQDRWINHYLQKYQPISSELSGDFLRENLLVEFQPQRGFAVIEREDEFATRATRWVFDG